MNRSPWWLFSLTCGAWLALGCGAPPPPPPPEPVTLTFTRAGEGAGSVASTVPGLSCREPCTARFASGTTLTLVATPEVGSSFAGWSQDCTGTALECVVQLDVSRQVTARFDKKKVELKVTVSGDGQGSVVSAPAGVSCPGTCGATFVHGTQVTLAASAAAGSTFAGFGGACAGKGPCPLTLTEPREVTAVFERVQHAVTVQLEGPGGGAVRSAPAGIDCGATCSHAFPEGTSLTLTASPDASSVFAGWSGGCSGTGTCTLAVGSPTSVRARFEKLTFGVSVTSRGTGGGTVSSNPTGVLCGPTCSAAFPVGTQVVLSANPDATSTFGGWGGACSGTGGCTVTVDGVKAVTARFDRRTFPLTVTRSGTGGGEVTSSPSGIACGAACTASFEVGTQVTLTAAPDTTSTFVGWSGACSGTGTCSVTVAGAMTVQARFEKLTYPVTLSRTGTGAGTITSTPAGISCGASCTQSFPAGTQLTLAAVADSTSAFGAWTGGCGTSATCTLTVNGPVTLSVRFDLLGAPAWARRFGGANDDYALGVAVDPNGDMVIVGEFAGSVDFGAGLVTAAGGSDAFIVKTTSTGRVLWARTYGGAGDDSAYNVAVDANGNAMVVGGFEQTVSFGTTTAVSRGASDGFALLLSPSGTLSSAVAFGGAGADALVNVSTDVGNNFLAVGGYTGTATLGNGTLTSRGGYDGVTVKFANAGTIAWAFSVGGTTDDYLTGVDADPGSNVTVAGFFTGTLGPLTSSGGRDVFWARYSGAAAALGAGSFGGAGDDVPTSLVIDGAGNLYVAGQYQRSLTLGNTTLTARGTADGFLAKLTSGGAHLWAKAVGSSVNARPEQIAVDGLGNVYLTGAFAGTANVGGGTLQAAGQLDALLAKFSPSGAHLWSKRLGGSAVDTTYSVAVYPTGESAVVGVFSGTADFGAVLGPITSAGGIDGFFASFQP